LSPAGPNGTDEAKEVASYSSQLSTILKIIGLLLAQRGDPRRLNDEAANGEGRRQRKEVK
jgi:hypothetical protein